MKINEVIKNINPEIFLKQKAAIKTLILWMKFPDSNCPLDSEQLTGVLRLMDSIQRAAEELGVVFDFPDSESSANLDRIRKELPQYSCFKDGKGTEYIVCEHFADGNSAILKTSTVSETMSFGGYNDYCVSNYRLYLNSDYLSELEDQFGADNIIPHKLYITSYSDPSDYECVMDKVSIRSLGDYLKYKDGLGGFHEIEPLATPSGEQDVLLVWSNGKIEKRPCSWNFCVRPFFYVKTEALSRFIEKEEYSEEKVDQTPSRNQKDVIVQKSSQTKEENPYEKDIFEGDKKGVTLKFRGYSDDIFGEYNVTGTDVSISEVKSSATCIINCLNYGRLMVVGKYSHLNNGCWMIGITRVHEDDDLPSWPMKYESCETFSLSMELQIDLPNKEFSMEWYVGDDKVQYYEGGKNYFMEAHDER